MGEMGHAIGSYVLRGRWRPIVIVRSRLSGIVCVWRHVHIRAGEIGARWLLHSVL